MRSRFILLLTFLSAFAGARTISGDSIPDHIFFESTVGVGAMNYRAAVPSIFFNVGYGPFCASMHITRSAKNFTDPYIFENAYMGGYRFYLPKGKLFTLSAGYSDIAFENGRHLIGDYSPQRFDKRSGVTFCADIQIPVHVRHQPYPINWDISYFTTFNSRNNLNGVAFGLNVALHRYTNYMEGFDVNLERPKKKDKVRFHAVGIRDDSKVIGRHVFISAACFLREIDIGYKLTDNSMRERTMMLGFRLPMSNYYWLFENPDLQMNGFCFSYAFDHIRKHKHVVTSSSFVINTRYNYFLKGWLSHYYHSSVDYSWLITREREDLSILWRGGWCTSPYSKFFSEFLFEMGPRLSFVQTDFFDVHVGGWPFPGSLDRGFVGVENGFTGGFEFRVRLMLGGGW